ncbi:MAG: GAF domain-containing protein [Chloroflexi bacterium]|nr:GAF domain-containing protein [Chloroflexota bacterium]
MILADYISIGIYWLLVIIWGLIVLVFLTRYEQPKAQEPRVATIARVVLLLGFAVLAIDSIYFSVWFTAKDEASKISLFTNLMQSEYLLIPKVGLLMAAIATLVMVWRRRIREIDKETENLRKISTLNAIAATVSQSLNLGEILNSTLEKVLEVMRVETGGIALMDEQTNELSFTVHRGFPEKLLHEADSLKPGQGLTGRAVQSGKPILVEDIYGEDDLSKIELRMKEEGFRSFACIPLGAKEKVLGVMDIASHDLRHFSTQDVELLTSIGNQIGVAIDNARLFHDLNEAYKDLAAAKAHLFQSAKLSAVGEFAAGIAHEIRNPLTTIIGDAQLLMADMKPGQPEYESLKAIERSGQRASEVIANLLSFSRREEYELIPININDSINSALSLIAYQIERSNITITKDLTADLPLVSASTHHLEEAWINLLLNARDAIPAKQRGEIRITSRLDGSGKAVQVLISDTGVGISKANLERMFEPFFTTKDVSEGTGLGLYLTYKIIARHNGSIEIDSEEGKGTTVTVTLPTENQISTEKQD